MHKLLGGLCAALLFLAGLPQIGHTAEPVHTEESGSRSARLRVFTIGRRKLA